MRHIDVNRLNYVEKNTSNTSFKCEQCVHKVPSGSIKNILCFLLLYEQWAWAWAFSLPYPALFRAFHVQAPADQQVQIARFFYTKINDFRSA